MKTEKSHKTGVGSMRRFRHAASCAAAVLILLGCATDGSRMQREGRALIDQGHVEEGLARLQDAAHEDPGSIAIRSELLRAREQVVARLVNSAFSERAAGRYEAAGALLERASRIDPENAKVKLAQDGLEADKRHADTLNEAQLLLKKGDFSAAREKVATVIVENPSNSRALALRKQIEDATAHETLAGPSLSNKLRKPVTLQFRDANLKMVLEALSRTSGINIVLDKDVRSDLKVTVFVKDTNIEDTLDLILFQNQLEKKVMGENTVLIYPNTPAKLKDYQDLKIRRFQLANADVKQAQTMLKTLLKTRDVFVDEKTNTVIIRDTPAAVRLAEKLVASLDTAEPEVMMEVEVLEVSRNRALELGLAWPSSITLGAENPQIQTNSSSFAGTSATSVSNTTTFVQNPNFTLGNLRRLGLNDLIVKSGVQWTLNLGKTDGDVNTLASPRIRARNREKAKILIGSRVPVITNSVTPVASGSPVVTGSVNYLDVGLKLEMEPNVHLDGDVAMKVNLEVSNITNVVNQAASGTRAYEIGTRNATTVLRLKDGETQILAGLIQDDQRSDATKIPALGEIPILGRLFGSQSDSARKTEIVLSITPHIVRNPQIYDVDTVEYWSGTENSLRTNTLSLKGSGASVIGGPSGVPGQPLAQAPRVTAPAPAALAPRTTSGESARPTAVSLVMQAPPQAKAGDKFNVVVTAQPGIPINTIGFMLGYDQTVFKVLSVTEGDLIRKANLPSNFSQDVDQAGGQVLVGLSDNSGGTTASGGSIAVVQFEVVAPKGGSQLTLSRINANGENDAPLTVNPPAPVIVNTAAP